MKVSLRWLGDFIELPTQDPQELAEVLASLGHEVEGTQRLERQFEGVVVGRVESVQPHPNADRLRLCRVTLGGEPQDVVCGAWNFEAGAIVPVSPPGAKLAGGLTVGARTIRGVPSHGMICSSAELGLGDEQTGIMVLDPNTPLGTDLAELVPLPDVVFDLSITPNRPDAMSVRGIARDLAAYYRLPVRDHEAQLSESGPQSKVTVVLDDPLGCPRYVGREVRDVSVGPSPLWIRLRLQAAGLRPINNVVDATNYVLMEMGQPLHGFDLDKIGGERIVVRRANKGERLTTLDGVDRELSEWDLVIADEARAVALAGVMGGEDSEVSEPTKRVLIEAAHFDPPTVMFTAKRHGLRTEASSRFERGVDPNLPARAAARAAQIMVEVAGGEAVSGVQDNYPEVIDPWQIELPLGEIGRLLGVEIDREGVEDLLERLGFRAQGADPLTVTVPTNRPDVRRPADLVEEVARLYGYDKIPETLPTGGAGGLTVLQRRERDLRAIMIGAGYAEANTFSFVGTDDLDRMELPVDDLRRDGIRVRNPLREEESLLRTTLLPGLLKSARFNISHGADQVALFEMGKVFLKEPSPADSRIPHQPDLLSFVVVGYLGARGLDHGRSADVYSAIATWRLLEGALGLSSTEVRQIQAPAFHPGRAAEVRVADEPIGVVGELHPAVVHAFGLQGRVSAGELRIEPLLTDPRWWQFHEPSTYPPVNFDLAFEMDTATPADRLVATVRRAGGEWLESVRIFDEFSGPSLGEGRKSVACQLVYRAPDHTLTNEEVAAHRRRIVETVESELGALLRGGG